jgi:hypothetical protein
MRKTAVAWELACDSAFVTMFRLIVAEQHLLTQTITPDDQRPRWSVEQCRDRADADNRAVAVTRFVETRYDGALAAGPVLLGLDPEELTALEQGGPIPPSLRNRAVTALARGRG